MASIKSRVATLEQASNATTRRPLTDAELAVRLVHILNNPELAPMHAPLREILQRSGCGEGLVKSGLRPA